MLTDAASEDTGCLYPTDEPTVGDSSVSIPVNREGLSEAWPIPVRISLRGTSTGRPGDLWSGTLDLPSGTLLVSDQSMSPMGHLDVMPGRYRVDVDRPTTPERTFEVYIAQA